MVKEQTARETAVPWPQSIAEFEALVDALGNRLVEFAFRRLQNRADAEDVVQDVLVRAYRDREKHRGVDNAVPFLFRMTANRATDVLRRRRKETGLPAEPTAAASDADPVLLKQAEGLLGRLPARQAEVIRLRVWGELSFEAVAQAMGCSLPTVKSRFRYGVQKLRKALERQGGVR